jgi:hypothetical protein
MSLTTLFRCSDSSVDALSVGEEQLEHRGDGIFAVPQRLLAVVRSTLDWLLIEAGIEEDPNSTPPAPVVDETSSDEGAVEEAPGETAPKRSRG